MSSKTSWKGMVVQTKVRLKTGVGILPAATICMVTKDSYSSHMCLISRPCPCCGMMFKVEGVESRQVLIIENSKKYLSGRKCERCLNQYVFKIERGYICPHCGVNFKYERKNEKKQK